MDSHTFSLLCANHIFGMSAFIQRKRFFKEKMPNIREVQHKGSTMTNIQELSLRLPLREFSEKAFYTMAKDFCSGFQ